MRRAVSFSMVAVALAIQISCVSKQPAGSSSRQSERLREWRKGVWTQGDGSFTIYTNTHYFVVSSTGDSSSMNLYVGASQIAFHEKGIARKQILRVRQMPGASVQTFIDSVINENGEEALLIFDTTLFIPGSCTLKNGILYDAIEASTDSSITLSTCNGDKEVVYSKGVSKYLPAGGGEAYSVRIEKL